MKIAVFIKQVPDNTKLKPDQIRGGQLPKEGVEMILNPFDEYALETAIRLKEAAGGESRVVVFSLGAESAREIIKKAIAAGADDGFILSDEAFKTGDSVVVAHVLAEAVKKLLPDADVLLFGQMALDGANGQTGPQVAELLGYPSLTSAKALSILDECQVKIQRETEQGIETYQATLPVVVCMMKCDYELRTSNIKGVMKANKTQIPVKSATDLGLSPDKLGREGSASRILEVRQRPPKAAGRKLDATNPQSAAMEIVRFLKDAKVL